MARKKTETVVVTWRVKEALRRRLEAAAARNEVSVNNEITRRIEESFARAEQVNLDRRIGVLEELIRKTEDERTKETLQMMSNAWLKLLGQRREKTEPAVRSAPQGSADPDHAEKFWSRHPGLDPDEWSRALSEEFNKRAEEEFERGQTELADWLWQKARETAGGPSRSAPDQEPELPISQPQQSKGG